MERKQKPQGLKGVELKANDGMSLREKGSLGEWAGGVVFYPNSPPPSLSV